MNSLHNLTRFYLDVTIGTLYFGGDYEVLNTQACISLNGGFDKISPSAAAPFQSIIRGRELLINAKIDWMGFLSSGLEDLPLLVGARLEVSDQFACYLGGTGEVMLDTLK